MKTKELREMDDNGLAQLEVEAMADYVKTRQAVREGTDKNNAKLSRLKRQIARIKTVRRGKKVE